MMPRSTGWRYLPQKMFVQVAAAVGLIIASHWMPPESQEFALRTGWGVVVLAIARWLSKQGKRQLPPNSGQKAN